MNSNQKGNIGVGIAISYFSSQLKTVSLPLNDSQPYDIVVEFPDGLKKVQVKTTTEKYKITGV
jgi:hypothetical protein